MTLGGFGASSALQVEEHRGMPWRVGDSDITKDFRLAKALEVQVSTTDRELEDNCGCGVAS
eukprot:4921421-Amphidinium_carterae.1